MNGPHGEVSPSNAARLSRLDDALLMLLAKRLARALLIEGAEGDPSTNGGSGPSTTSKLGGASPAARLRS